MHDIAWGSVSAKGVSRKKGKVYFMYDIFFKSENVDNEGEW